MKKISIILLLCLTGTGLFAQQDSTATEGLEGHSLEIGLSKEKGLHAQVHKNDSTNNETDTITIKTRRKVHTIITRPRRPDEWTESQRADSVSDAKRERRNSLTNWAGLDIGLNNWVNSSGELPSSGAEEAYELELVGSRFFSINFMEQKVEFGTPYVGLLTGLGLEFANYKFKNNVRLAYNNDTTFMIQNTDTAGSEVLVPDLRKNKLRQIGVRAPLMLEFNTSTTRSRSFHLAVGVVGSLYFDTMYKQKFTQDGEKRKTRDKGDFNLLPYRLAATARIGYGGLNLFAEYSLTPLFEDGKGLELSPVNVGLTLLAF